MRLSAFFLLALAPSLLAALACGDRTGGRQPAALRAGDSGVTELPNNHPIPNPGGSAASFSTEGYLDLDNAYHTPQGSNGRRCSTCHFPEDGWSITPATAQRLFEESAGLHPLFNLIDANTPTADLSTVDARRRAFSMVLQGKFVRLRKPPASRAFEVVAADDPFAFGSTEQLLFFRRPGATANLRGHTVMWDGANTVGTSLRDGLIKQARSNVTGAQQGSPAPDEVIFAIVDHELTMSHAQLEVPGAGRLDGDGARGGPEAHAGLPLIAGRFDLYDAWIGDGNPTRAEIARGQELFNAVNPGSGQSCRGCHTAANNGQNVAGDFFDIGTADGSRRKPDMAVYTLQRTGTEETRQTTDWGRAGVTGLWEDVNRFKVPSLRGLAARPSYFHNGLAATLPEVLTFYESSRGFTFSDPDRADLLAFLNAL
jgi:cytochrome c peroxidase